MYNLELLGIYELRNLARSLGVNRPTTLLRAQLIEQIQKQLQSNTQTQPVLSTRGRPPRSTGFDITRILEPEVNRGLYDAVLDLPNEDAVRSPIGTTDNVLHLRGFVHTTTRGHGILIASCLNTYQIPLKLMTVHRLETGDGVEARAAFDDVQKAFIVDTITANTQNRFEKLPSARPQKQIGNLDMRLGQRCLVQTAKVFDRVEDIVKTQAGMPAVYKIALLLEESDDAAAYLLQNKTDEVFLAKVNYNIKKQIMLVLTALFTAKQHAAAGKNVVFFVDNLNKLFKIYNASSFDTGQMPWSQVNLTHLVDLKSLFMSAKQIQGGGSLTMVCYINEPTNDVDSFVHNEFSDVANILLNAQTHAKS